MTTDELTRLRALPKPSPAMLRYTAALAAFLEEDRPGQYRAPAGRITAKDDMEEAWAALPYSEREIVRATEGGKG